MPYNLSTNAYNIVKDILNELLDIKESNQTWQREFDDAHKAAHFIRQGMKYCEVNRERVGDRLADLKHQLKVSVNGNVVTISKKFTTLSTGKLVGIHSKTFEGVVNLIKIMETVIKNPQYNEYVFPDALLSTDEGTKLVKFCTVNDLIINRNGDEHDLTITRNTNVITKKEEEASNS